MASEYAVRLHLDQISREQFVGQCIRIASLSVGMSSAALLVFGVGDSGKSSRCIARYDRRFDVVIEDIRNAVLTQNSKRFAVLQAVAKRQSAAIPWRAFVDA